MIDYGLRLVSLELQLTNGGRQQLIQGGWPLADYEQDSAYQGAVIGRSCNRIRAGLLALNGKQFQLDQNEGDHHLHGGFNGLHNRVWRTEPNKNGLESKTRLSDGESGYPGNVDITVQITISDGSLNYFYSAKSDQDTVLDLTNHAYFCLDDSGTIAEHFIQVDADLFAPIDDEFIPKGELLDVTSTPFDLRSYTRIQKVLTSDSRQLALAAGLDHAFLLKTKRDTGRCARLKSLVSGIEMEVLSSSPAIQVYTGNHLPQPHSAICLETQHLPDACHHAKFQTPVLRADQFYEASSCYRFTQGG